jgi:hypothetical protein
MITGRINQVTVPFVFGVVYPTKTPVPFRVNEHSLEKAAFKKSKVLC